MHCDVKPANIFVTRDGTGVLGDFDVSRDAATRASMATAATRIAGGTWLYMAPEVANGSAASSASDVYSFGLVVYDLFFVPKRGADDKLEFQRAKLSAEAVVPPRRYANEPLAAPLDELLKSMLARDAATRPTASAALGSKLFALRLDGAVGERDPQRDRRTCLITLNDDLFVDQGLECDSKHFLCDEALAHYVRTQSAIDVAAQHDGYLPCPIANVRRRIKMWA